MQVVAEENVGPELDAAVRRLLCECFPTDANAFAARRAWNGVRPAFTVIACCDEHVVGHVGVVVRQVVCGTSSICVAGVQSLAVASRWRRSGLSQQLMTAAMHEARVRGPRHGLLFCLPALEGFYARLAWRRIDRAVMMRDAVGRTVALTAKNICMELALAGDLLPSGPIDLAGRDW